LSIIFTNQRSFVSDNVDTLQKMNLSDNMPRQQWSSPLERSHIT